MPPIQRKLICARLKQAREDAGLTQQEIADALEVHKNTIGNYESFRVPWDRLDDWAELTGRDRDWLVYGDNHTTEEQTKLREAVREEIQDIPVREAVAEALAPIREDLESKADRLEAMLQLLLEEVRRPADSTPPD